MGRLCEDGYENGSEEWRGVLPLLSLRLAMGTVVFSVFTFLSLRFLLTVSSFLLMLLLFSILLPRFPDLSQSSPPFVFSAFLVSFSLHFLGRIKPPKANWTKQP